MNNIFNDIHTALKDRSQWERKQALWHKLRFQGIKRTSLPYDGAPNVTYPLADTMIEKLKPLFLQQIYSSQTVATFVSKKEQNNALAKLAELWFDYQLKQCSNFEKAIHTLVDEHLQDSFSVVKVRWDDKKDQLVLEAIDPLYIIVPWYSEELQEVDWLVHVYKVSADQYLRNQNYSKKDEGFVASITGKSDEPGQRSEEQERQTREGITQIDDDKQIVLWEVYYKEPKSNKWIVRTISPLAGWDTPVRQLYLPDSYKGKLPFVKVSCDLNEAGWYSPRGICEIAARFQQSLSKQWCNQLQWMDYNAQPDFQNTSGAPVNAQNFQRRPGGILPPGIVPNRANEMPIDFVQQMQFVRALAEDRIQMPDLSSGEHLSGKHGAQGDVTATQINAIVGQSNQGNDMRSRVFRLQVGPIYDMCWMLLVKNTQPENITFLQEQQVAKVPPEALHLDYEIHPSGSADSWNTSAQAQKAMGVYQLWNNQPGVNQRELKSWLAERVDVQLIKRVLTNDGDDALQTIQMIMQFVQQSAQNGQHITPDVAKLLLGLGQHGLQELQQKGDSRVQDIAQKVGPVAQVLAQIAQSPPPPQQGGPQLQGKPPIENLSYKDAPPSIRRQMEMQAGMQPATPQESQLEMAERAPAPPPSAQPAPPAEKGDSIPYKDAPSSVRRQMELGAGMLPASPQESQLEMAQKMPKPSATAGGKPGSKTAPTAAKTSPSQAPAAPAMDAKMISALVQQMAAAQKPPIVNVAAPIVNMPPTGKKIIKVNRNAKGDIESAEVETK